MVTRFFIFLTEVLPYIYPTCLTLVVQVGHVLPRLPVSSSLKSQEGTAFYHLKFSSLFPRSATHKPTSYYLSCRSVKPERETEEMVGVGVYSDFRPRPSLVTGHRPLCFLSAYTSIVSSMDLSRVHRDRRVVVSFGCNISLFLFTYYY